MKKSYGSIIILFVLFSAAVAWAAPGGQAYKDGKASYEGGNYGKAIELFQQSLSENPEHYAGKSNYMIALCYKKMKQCNKAGIFFKKALEGDKDNGGASSMTKFEEQLKACNLSKASLAAIAATELPSDASSPVPTGEDPFAHEYEVQIANGQKLVDLTGVLTASDKKTIESLIEDLADDNKMQVRVAVSKGSLSAPDEMVGKLLKASSADGGSNLIVLIAGNRIYSAGSSLSESVKQRAIQQAEPLALKAVSGRSGHGLMAEAFLKNITEVKGEEQATKSRSGWFGTFVVLALIGGGVAFIIRRRKQQAQIAAQDNEYATNQLMAIQESLFDDARWFEYSTKYDPARVQQIQTGLQLEFSQLSETKDPIGLQDLQKRIKQLEANPNSVFAALRE